MTKIEARIYLARFNDLSDEFRHTCSQGHAECAIIWRGPCLDEAIKAALPKKSDAAMISQEQYRQLIVALLG